MLVTLETALQIGRPTYPARTVRQHAADAAETTGDDRQVAIDKLAIDR